MAKITNKTLEELLQNLRNVSKEMSVKRIMGILATPANNAAGTRFHPPENTIRDQKVNVRIDRGEVHDGVQYLNLQVNKQAEKKSLRSIDTHEKLGTVKYHLNKDHGPEMLDEIIDAFGPAVLEGKVVDVGETPEGAEKGQGKSEGGGERAGGSEGEEAWKKWQGKGKAKVKGKSESEGESADESEGEAAGKKGKGKGKEKGAGQGKGKGKGKA
ncbi:MAG: hypothetical protein Q9170_007161 [Blastenia crenularia]